MQNNIILSFDCSLVGFYKKHVEVKGYFNHNLIRQLQDYKGRSLNILKVIVSTHYLTMKFPIDHQRIRVMKVK
ncbi:hypothetical protein CR513_00656, partial [Mucuna pruriens]